MKKFWFAVMLLLLSFSSLLPSLTFAHTNNSEGFSHIEVKEKSLNYELKLDLQELGQVLNKETDQKEFIGHKAVQDYINSKINLYADSELIEGNVEKTDIEMIKDRPFAVINLAYSIEHKPEKLVVEYNMFLDDSDPSHANFATIHMDGKQQETIFTFESRELEIGEVSFWKNAKQFLVLGLKHIFTGYDHILFVISLLIGAKKIRHIITLVTTFTIAHSVTLALATLQMVQIPGKLVESAIALSIIYVALQNLLQPDSKHNPWIAFAFGLIHGFGFAGILSEMDLLSSHFASSLLFFNIGIELGQILIVSLVFPLLLFIQKRQSTKWFIPGLSTAVLLFGLVWFMERAFNITLIS